MPRKKVKPCVSVDWLQVHTKIVVCTLFDQEFSPSGRFKIAPKDIRHNVFGKHREISVMMAGEWQPCAVFSYAPLSSVLPLDCGHLKVINRFLYQDDLQLFVNDILSDLQLKFVSVSRLDIAFDFRSFYRKSVPVFFKQVVNRSILKRRATSLHLDAKATKSFPIHYMRFGSRSTPLHFYIYNKSKELREAKDKPHIKAKWLLCGLNYESYDVWRCEFVLMPSKFGVVDTETSEVLQFNDLSFLDDRALHDLFFTLFFQHCSFVVNDGQARKDRMEAVVLLNALPYHRLFVRVSEKVESNRMDKVKIKFLHELNQAWRDHNKDPVTVEDALSEFVDKRGLQWWYSKL